MCLQLQERVIEDILSGERDAAANAAAPGAVDRIQQAVTEEVKDALRRQSVDREIAKRAIRFLGEPMGKALHARLKKLHGNWLDHHDDGLLVGSVAELAEELFRATSSQVVPQSYNGKTCS